MSSATPQVRSLYRRLLRELPPSSSVPIRTQHQKLSAPSPLQQRIRASIAQSQSSEQDSSRQIEHAEQFTHYLQAQRMYLTLIERYNPGMGMSEEERVRLSARRVGMDLPVEYGKGEGGEK